MASLQIRLEDLAYLRRQLLDLPLVEMWIYDFDDLFVTNYSQEPDFPAIFGSRVVIFQNPFSHQD